MSEDPHEKRGYGSGSISTDSKTGRTRLRLRNHEADVDKSLYFETREEAELVKKAYEKLNTTLGITLREWGEVWFSEHDYSKSARDTWRSVVSQAPFIDWPLTRIDAEAVTAWTVDLIEKPASRSVLRRGVRTLVKLDKPISRGYAKGALSYLRVCLQAAVSRIPRLIPKNPAADIKLPKPKGVNGKIRTKKAKRNHHKLDFLPQPDCSKVFFCAACEEATGVPSYDLEQLVTCKHVPFFYRVGLSVTVMQGLRQGEVCSQRWERFTTEGAQAMEGPELRLKWTDAPDWSGQVWLINTSWQEDTKNGQDRWQALFPMSARMLHRWWELKGRPQTGLVFAKADAPWRRPIGELAKFVEEHKHCEDDMLIRLARDAGLVLQPRRLATIRSQARRRALWRRDNRDKMFAKGYDFGWADTDARDDGGVLYTKPGYVTKLGLRNRTRFHDFRDTAATHLLSGTWGPVWSMQLVSEFLGHSDIQVTQARYAHLTHAVKTAAAALVDPAQIVRKMSDSPTEPHAANGLFSGAPEARLERATTRLTVNKGQRDSAMLSRHSDNVRTILAEEAARRLLAAAAAGEPLLATALQLAGAVLEGSEAPAQPGLRVVK
jgi:integrase